MTDKIILNRKQLSQILEIFKRFQDIEEFTIEQTHSSGIGPAITIKFNLFDKNKNPDTNIDITDVSTW